MGQEEYVPTFYQSAFLPTFLRHLGVKDLWADEDRSLQKATSYSLSEDENKIYLEVPMPGLRSEDINISYDKGVVRINAEHKLSEENKKRKYYERAFYRYSFCYALPGNIDEAKDPHATYENGILALQFDKMRKEEPRKISIKSL